MQRRRTVLLLALSTFLSACATYRSPFPSLGSLSEAEVLATVHTRCETIRSLYAELEIIHEGPTLAGTFEAAMYFQRPRHFRFTAFKNLVLSVRPVFDFAVTPTHYALELQEEDDPSPTVDRGKAGDLAAAHPRFAGFFWAGEAFWNPGVRGPDRPARVIARTDREIRIETWLTSGARARWQLDPRTLEVRKALVEAPTGDRYELAYSRYRVVGGAFVPGQVSYRDLRSESIMEAHLGHCEINSPVDPLVFDPFDVGR